MRVFKSAAELLGKTPIIEVSGFAKHVASEAKILAKVELFNPGGSVKDRLAYAVIKDAEATGRLQPGGTIVEASSGNTGIGLAALGTALGYKVIITMPETMSVERRQLIKAYGAELVLTDGSLGMKGAIAKAEELVEAKEGAILAGQFVNAANPRIHYETTGPEIWADTEGQIDVFVAGVGTGGTITGVGTYLKERNPNIKVVAVEPSDSAVLSGNPPGPHKIQGIGAGFVPQILDTNIYDEIITVGSEDAFAAARIFGQTEGILVGISSGAALHAATLLAKRPEWKQKTVVVLLPDTGERYLSTPLYADV